MTQPGKFVMDKKVMGTFLKSDQLLAAQVDHAAEAVKKEAGPGATVEHYTTDRHVAGIVVRAIDQAKHGALTKAMGITGARLEQQK